MIEYGILDDFPAKRGTFLMDKIDNFFRRLILRSANLHVGNSIM